MKLVIQNQKYNNQIKIWKTFYCKNPDKYLPISNDIILKISTYLGNLIKCNCFHKNESAKKLFCKYEYDKLLNYKCNCGCDYCTNNYNYNCTCEDYIYENRYNYDDDYYYSDDRDTHYNGDDY